MSKLFFSLIFIFSSMLYAHNNSLSSISSNISIYTRDVERAYKTDFDNFRRLEGIIDCYEHVSKKLARKFYREIKNNYSDLFNFSSKFELNDKVGNPLYVKNYNGLGFLAPTTLRYIFIYGEIRKLFNLKENCKIVEVGCGHGGQCATIASDTKFSDYKLIDLPIVLPLIKKYLYSLNITNVSFSEPSIKLEENYDLFISNYGISEVYKEGQDEYIKNVICKCKRGYILYNNTSNGRAYSKEEFCKKLTVYGLKPKITKESIDTYFGKNVLITWGTD